jgi:phosphoglycerol transferase MdoB-like AlkP superfamily enzyme
MYRMISYSYFDRMLKDDMSERGVTGKAYFDPAFRLIMGDKKYKFTKLIRSISGEVIDEAAKAEKEAQAKAKAEQKQREKELKALKKAKKKK